MGLIWQFFSGFSTEKYRNSTSWIFLLLYLLWFSLNKQIIFRRKKLDFPSNSSRILRNKWIFRGINKLNFFRQIAMFVLILIGNQWFWREKFANWKSSIFTSKWRVGLIFTRKLFKIEKVRFSVKLSVEKYFN